MELRQRLLLSLCAAIAAFLAAPAASAASALPQLTALRDAGAAVSALVLDLESGRTLASIQPTDRLTPASLSKLYVAAAALSSLPPDRTFRTQLLAATLPSGESLAGDLVLRGGGDSTLDEQALWALGAQLRGLGLRQIRGRVLVERAPFGELDCDTKDRCSAQRRSRRAFNAAPSAIGVNYGSWCLAIRPTRTGQPASLRSCGATLLPIPVEGRILTGAGSPSVERSTDDGGDRLRVSGSIAPGEEQQIHRAMSDPALGAGLLLRVILQQLGIEVTGGVETTLTAPAGLVPVAAIDGLQVQEQVARMMRYSNNYIADVMTMNVALSRLGAPPRSLADASLVLVEGLPDPPLLTSGSGLTTENRASARDLVTLLQRQYKDTRHFPLFYGSLVVPHDAPFAYLRSGDREWQDRVALKTGSLSDPVSVYGLAGYLRGRDGGFIAFALIVNGTSRMPSLAMDRSLGAMRADLTALLREY